ncbi:UNVERIFIED_CONTAM: putative galacturonosyltransferase 7 [Sesamum radiatum]|uniref:Galacturonosyltransferase 7 n=1 Tax=Sesamum radiatum TaxID=300843 RepID=A0AAW2KVZ6_SESRA
MKGGGGGVSSSYSLPAKRRWKGLVIAVLGLVFLSMLVPLVFLLGLHSGFHSTTGYGTEQRNSASVHHSTHMDDLIRRLTPTLPKGLGNNSVNEAGNDTNGFTMRADLPKQVKENSGSLDGGNNGENMRSADESEMICELKFGSYCLWRREQREKMEDSVVKRMKDLLFVARAYYPSIAKLPKLDKLSHELKQNIQDFERVLSETTTDRDLPPQYVQMKPYTLNMARSARIWLLFSEAPSDEFLNHAKLLADVVAGPASFISVFILPPLLFSFYISYLHAIVFLLSLPGLL